MARTNGETEGVGPDWIAADWGTTHLRVWAMTGAGEAIAEARSDAGMGTLDPADYEQALLDLVGPWLGRGPVDVVACGMVGARQGWVEAGYAAVPCAPLAPGAVRAPAADPRLRVRVIPGLKQDSPADVMRGEEAQIAGWLAAEPGFDGVVCLPGTHSKWALISAGEVVSFQTFLTGELFALLSGRSVLRHTTATEGWDDAAFAEAIATAMAKPEMLAARLFGLRAEALLHDADARAARARLSGLLIGAELAAARPYWLGQRVAVVGGAEIAATYAAALEAQGVPAETADGAAMTRAGLTAARARLAEAA